MYKVLEHPAFTYWFSTIKDRMTKRRLARRIERLEQGNFGDFKHVGQGVFELREYFGPGWRMYFVKKGEVYIIMMGGGTKSSQQQDIGTAIKLSTTIEDS